MASIDNSSESVPIPALLVERATALARAEAGLALVHTRRIAVGAVGALLGTIVACAFAQLALVLLVAWPVLADHVPLLNLLFGVLTSVLLSAAAGGVAITTWLGVARERRSAAGRDAASRLSSAPEPAHGASARARTASEPPRTASEPPRTASEPPRSAGERPRSVQLAERMSP